MAVGAVEHSRGAVGAAVGVLEAVAVLDGGGQDRAVADQHPLP